jgi:predicted small secreted protein
MASIKRIKRFSRLLPLCAAVLVILSGCGKDVSKGGDALEQERAELQEEALRLTANFNYNAAGAVLRLRLGHVALLHRAGPDHRL